MGLRAEVRKEHVVYGIIAGPREQKSSDEFVVPFLRARELWKIADALFCATRRAVCASKRAQERNLCVYSKAWVRRPGALLFSGLLASCPRVICLLAPVFCARERALCTRESGVGRLRKLILAADSFFFFGLCNECLNKSKYLLCGTRGCENCRPVCVCIKYSWWKCAGSFCARGLLLRFSEFCSYRVTWKVFFAGCYEIFCNFCTGYLRVQP